MTFLCTLTEDERRNRDIRTEEMLFLMSRGDVSAMGSLYSLVGKDIYAYALSKTASHADAEDIMHDTLVQVWKNATRYQPMGKPLAWIFTIEMNIIRRQYNSSQRYIPLDAAQDLGAEAQDIQESIVTGEFLRELLDTLGEDEREIISLHIVSGLKHREIARLLGKPLSTVLSKYNRAIKKLKKRIEEKERSE